MRTVGWLRTRLLRQTSIATGVGSSTEFFHAPADNVEGFLVVRFGLGERLREHSGVEVEAFGFLDSLARVFVVVLTILGKLKGDAVIELE